MGSNNSDYSRQYFINNRERITKRMYEHINCPLCGCSIVRSHMNRHQKTVNCSKLKEHKKA